MPQNHLQGPWDQQPLCLPALGCPGSESGVQTVGTALLPVYLMTWAKLLTSPSLLFLVCNPYIARLLYGLNERHRAWCIVGAQLMWAFWFFPGQTFPSLFHWLVKSKFFPSHTNPYCFPIPPPSLVLNCPYSRVLEAGKRSWSHGEPT